MTQVEQVVGALEKCGGYATFSELNQHIDTSAWGTKTPAASIRGIVQTHPKLFYRIVPGNGGWCFRGRDVMRPNWPNVSVQCEGARNVLGF